MSAFWRYFIHFMLITNLLVICIMLMTLISVDMELSLFMTVIFLFGCIYFSFFMALFCKDRAEIITLITKNDNKTMLKIKEIIINKVGKKEIVEENEKITHYYNKTKYLKWLTNEITVVKEEHFAKINVPRDYVKLFKPYLL